MRVAPGGVLALDLSSKVGFCIGHLSDRLPHFGVWLLPKSVGEGGRFAAFENTLIEALNAWAPSHIVLEAPLNLAALLGKTNFKVISQQITLRGIAFAEAWRRQRLLSISEIGADKVREAMLGQSRFKKGTVKNEVMAYCRGRGWAVSEDNSADACLTWAWHGSVNAR